MLSDYNVIKLKINNRKILVIYVNIRELNNILINNLQVKEEIQREIKKFLK